jgi:hypothetical protein
MVDKSQATGIEPWGVDGHIHQACPELLAGIDVGTAVGPAVYYQFGLLHQVTYRKDIFRESDPGRLQHIRIDLFNGAATGAYEE